jgi:hypothetical protein
MMSTTARRRTAKIVLAISILGGAALAANNDLLSPTADGGLPGPIIEPGKPWPTVTFKSPRPPTSPITVQPPY